MFKRASDLIKKKEKILKFLDKDFVSVGLKPYDSAERYKEVKDIEKYLPGLKFGRTYLLYGPFASGKTRFAMFLTSIYLIDYDKYVLWIDTEGSFNANSFKDMLFSIMESMSVKQAYRLVNGKLEYDKSVWNRLIRTIDSLLERVIVYDASEKINEINDIKQMKDYFLKLCNLDELVKEGGYKLEDIEMVVFDSISAPWKKVYEGRKHLWIKQPALQKGLNMLKSYANKYNQLHVWIAHVYSAVDISKIGMYGLRKGEWKFNEYREKIYMFWGGAITHIPDYVLLFDYERGKSSVDIRFMDSIDIPPNIVMSFNFVSGRLTIYKEDMI